MRRSVAAHNLCIQRMHEDPNHDAVVRVGGEASWRHSAPLLAERGGGLTAGPSRLALYGAASIAKHSAVSTARLSRRVRSSSKMGLCACGRGSSVSSPGPRPLLERRHAQMKRPMPMVSQTEIARVSVRLVTHAFRVGLRDARLVDPGLARSGQCNPRRAWPAPCRRKSSSISLSSTSGVGCRTQPLKPALRAAHA